MSPSIFKIALLLVAIRSAPTHSLRLDAETPPLREERESLYSADVSIMPSSSDIASALVYAYPLALYVQTFYPVIEAIGINKFQNDNTTSSASSASLVRPNPDYVYSAMALDLSHDNVLINIPNISDGRSFVYPFYDLYGNNFANLGSATSSPPGTYLIRPAANRPGGLTMYGPDSTCGYKGVIDSPTVFGSMKARILLRNNGSDLANVHTYQNQTQTLSILRNSAPLAPRLNTSLLQYGALAGAAYSAPNELNAANSTALLELLATVAPYNPPENPKETAHVNAVLSRAGITAGSYTPAPNLNISEVNAIISANHLRVLTPNNATWDYHGNNWWDLTTAESGDFHTHYLIRAYIAYTGYLQLRKHQALYPEYFGSGAYLSLSGTQSYILTFSSKPPAQFWSVTVYGSDNYLVPNPLQRYSLGATSESLTYPNGTPVYPTGQDNAQRNGDSGGNGAFQLLLQSSDLSPPTNWTDNWIPTAAGGGQFTVNFRTYGPNEALTNGSYVYPVVTKQAAVI